MRMHLMTMTTTMTTMIIMMMIMISMTLFSKMDVCAYLHNVHDSYHKPQQKRKPLQNS